MKAYIPLLFPLFYVLAVGPLLFLPVNRWFALQAFYGLTFPISHWFARESLMLQFALGVIQWVVLGTVLSAVIRILEGNQKTGD